MQLVKAKVHFPPNNAGISGRNARNEYDTCKRTNCKYCTSLIKSNQVKSTHTGRKYTLKSNSIEGTCLTTNLIYCITCSKCQLQYVGETKRRLCDRLREHRYDTNSHKDSPVAKHFNQKGHRTSNIEIQIVEIIKLDPDDSATTTLRRHRERFWIYQLGTIAPLGINIKEYWGFPCYLLFTFIVFLNPLTFLSILFSPYSDPNNTETHHKSTVYLFKNHISYKYTFIDISAYIIIRETPTCLTPTEGQEKMKKTQSNPHTYGTAQTVQTRPNKRDSDLV